MAGVALAGEVHSRLAAKIPRLEEVAQGVDTGLRGFLRGRGEVAGPVARKTQGLVHQHQVAKAVPAQVVAFDAHALTIAGDLQRVDLAESEKLAGGRGGTALQEDDEEHGNAVHISGLDALSRCTSSEHP